MLNTKDLLGGATLKKTDKKSKTAKTKKTQRKSNFDRDTSDEEMDVTGSLSENETDTEEEEPMEEQDDAETTGGLLIGSRTGCPMQQAATARISSEAEHILNNTLTKSQDQLILEGKETTEGTKAAELIPEAFSDTGLETLRKEVNETNREKPMPKPTPVVAIQTPGTSSAFKPPSNQDKGKYISTGIIDRPDPGNR